MSAPDELRFGEDGFVDMDAFPDDGTDLDPGALSDLREALLSDPVTEPDAVGWDALLDAALDAPADEPPAVDGPFAVDGPEPPASADLVDIPDDDLAGWLDTDLAAEGDDAALDAPADEAAGGVDDGAGVDAFPALDLDPGAGTDPFDPGDGSVADGVVDDAGFDVGDVP